MIKRYSRTILEGKVIKFYKIISPMVLILSLVGTSNASSFHGSTGAIVTNSIPEPYSMVLLGIGLIGLARISKKKFKINKSTV
jgi:hypothetical protein